MSKHCPTAEELAGLLDERLPEPQRSVVAAHLRECEPCCEALSRLANTWSLGDAVAEDQPISENTREFESRCKAVRPIAIASGAEVPARALEIAGYDGLELITTGGMGVVYRGNDTALNRSVAVKLISAHVILSDAGRQRAMRESRLLAKLDHPFICKIYAAGSWCEHPFLVMEWIDGPTLQERIDDSPLSPLEAARIARDLVDALSFVHANDIVHRDLKPDNVLLAAVSATRPLGIPKLIDFGLSHSDELGQLAISGDPVLGTPSFMAAEQTGLDESLGPITAATDIHGLGGLLFAMVTGHAPYKAASPMASMQRAVKGEITGIDKLGILPQELKGIVLKCLQPRPELRYESASAVAEALDRFLASQAPPTPPSSEWDRRRLAPLLVASVSLLIVGASIWAGRLGVFDPRSFQAGEATAMQTRGDVLVGAGDQPKAQVVTPRLPAEAKAEEAVTLVSESQTPEQEVLGSLKAMRQRLGLAPFRSNERLNRGAQSHAEVMARTGFLSDLINEDDFLQSRIAPTGYRCQMAAQLITADVEPQDVADRLLREPRYTNLLSGNFPDVGIGAAIGPEGRRYYVVLLAVPVP